MNTNLNNQLKSDMRNRRAALVEMLDDIAERIEQLNALQESLEDAIETTKELGECEDAEEGDCYAADLIDTLKVAEGEIAELFDMDAEVRKEWLDDLYLSDPCLSDIGLHYFS